MLFGVTRRERTGVLVLLVWTESDQADSIRARVTTDDERAGPRTYVAGGGIDEVVDVIRRWVLAFLARSAINGNDQ